MNKMKLKSIEIKTIYFVMSVCVACTSKEIVDDEKQQNIMIEDRQKVEAVVVHKSLFNNEIVSNGRICSNRYSDVYWEVDGTISDIYTANGRYIKQGEKISQLESFKLHNAYESAKASMENSRLSMYETLIGQGYSPDSTNIPENVKELAAIKSGFLQSEANYKASKYDYEHSTLYAPISGVVANLGSRPSNRADRSKAFCRIIDPSSMCVEFTIIENELSIVKQGCEVEVKAFAEPNKVWKGKVIEVNPYVEANGMVRVKASIDNGTDLFEGMNVSIKIRRSAGEFLSVPKSAIVLRSNREVVFVAKKGLAQWCYVETSIENSDNIAILSGISEGDSVIVKGNMYLAHNSEIDVE